jgi:hypothetical protein
MGESKPRKDKIKDTENENTPQFEILWSRGKGIHF